MIFEKQSECKLKSEPNPAFVEVFLVRYSVIASRKTANTRVKHGRRALGRYFIKLLMRITVFS